MIANPLPEQPDRKLFFALWPDARTRAALTRLQEPVAGRLTPPDKLHLTMAFLGPQPISRVPALLDILAGIALPPMRLQLDCYGYFTRPRIAWAGMRDVPRPLLDVQGALMRRLEEQGFSPATHSEFRPHVTLAREAKAAPPQDVTEPVLWEVKELALVESTAGGLYLPLR